MRTTEIDGTTWWDWYCSPQIAKPTGLDNLHPGLGDCSLAWRINDPPMALTGAGDLIPTPPTPLPSIENPPISTRSGIALSSIKADNAPAPTAQPETAPKPAKGRPSSPSPNHPADPGEASIPPRPEGPGSTPGRPKGDLDQANPDGLSNQGGPNNPSNPSNPADPQSPGIPAAPGGGFLGPANNANPGQPSRPDTTIVGNPVPRPDGPSPPLITPPPTWGGIPPSGAHPAAAALILGDHTILPGRDPIIISNTPFSLDPSGVLHVGDKGIALPPITPIAQQVPFIPGGFRAGGASGTGDVALGSPASFTLDGHTFSVIGPSALDIGGVMLTAGGTPVTIGGEVVKLNDGNQLVVGDKTYDPRMVPMPTPTGGAGEKVADKEKFCNMIVKGMGWYGVGSDEPSASSGVNAEAGKVEKSSEDGNKNGAARSVLSGRNMAIAMIMVMMLG